MVAQVVSALNQRGAHFEVLHHHRAWSGLQEAMALGLPVDDVLKAVVLETRRGCVLAVLPANRRLDLGLVRDATGDRRARLATEQEIQHALPGCELGSVPPLGSIVHVPVYVDPEVMRHPFVAFAAGTQTDSVRGPVAELFRGEDVRVTALAQVSAQPWAER